MAVGTPVYKDSGRNNANLQAYDSTVSVTPTAGAVMALFVETSKTNGTSADACTPTASYGTFVARGTCIWSSGADGRRVECFTLDNASAVASTIHFVVANTLNAGLEWWLWEIPGAAAAPVDIASTSQQQALTFTPNVVPLKNSANVNVGVGVQDQNQVSQSQVTTISGAGWSAPAAAQTGGAPPISMLGVQAAAGVAVNPTFGTNLGTGTNWGALIAEFATGLVVKTATASLTGGGVVARTAVKRALRTQAMTGGGVVVRASQKTATAIAIATGGGIVVPIALTARVRTQALSGGGVIAATQASGRAQTQSLTGGGVVVATRAAYRVRTQAMTGGGVAVAAGVSARARTQAMTGGGVVVAVRSAGRLGAQAFTGGGVLVAARVAQRVRTQAMTGGGVLAVGPGLHAGKNVGAITGGGVVAASRQKGSSTTVAASGGGVAVVTRSSTRSAVQSLSGGGVAATVRATSRFAISAPTGGGVVASSYAKTMQIVKTGTASLTGGGVAATAQTTARAVPASPAYRGAILATAGLRAYWRLGEGSGTAAADELGGNPATYQNAPTLGVAGGVPGNTAVAFNGTNQYVDAPDSAALDLGDVLTIEAWIKPGPTGGTRPIVSKGAGAYCMRLNPNGSVRLVASGGTAVAISTVLLTTSAWRYVVATKNGATSKIYVDGVDVTGAGSNVAFIDTSQPLAIGADQLTTFQNGSLDEVALYDRALTAAEVAAHYAAATAVGGAVLSGGGRAVYSFATGELRTASVSLTGGGAAAIGATSARFCALSEGSVGLADGSPISPWPDMSGTVGHEGTIVGTPAPVFKAGVLNGKPVVRFTVNEGRVRGSSGILSSGLPNPGQNSSIFYVGRIVGPYAGRLFSGVYPATNFTFGFHTSGYDVAYNGSSFMPSATGFTSFPTAWRRYAMTCQNNGSGGTDYFYADGVQLGTAASGTGLQDGYNLSGYDATAFTETCDGEVAELLIWNRELTTTERGQVDAYLNAKWFGVGSSSLVPTTISGLNVWLDASQLGTVTAGNPMTGGGSITYAYQRRETRFAVAALSGGGVVALTRASARAGAATASGGGVVASVAVHGGLRTAGGTGGGVISRTGLAGRSSAQTATGGGVIARTGLKGSLSTMTATGGGVVTPAPASARLGSRGFTGGGTVVTTREAVRLRSQAMTGGGVVTTASMHVGQAAQTLTGGGVVVSSRQRAAAASVGATGGGVAAISRGSARQGAQALSGGGVASASRSTARLRVQAFTGGGIAITSGSAGRLRTASLPGGGVAVIAKTTARQAAVPMTGGGRVVYTYATGELRTAFAALTGGGVATVTGVATKASTVRSYVVII